MRICSNIYHSIIITQRLRSMLGGQITQQAMGMLLGMKQTQKSMRLLECGTKLALNLVCACMQCAWHHQAQCDGDGAYKGTHNYIQGNDKSGGAFAT